MLYDIKKIGKYDVTLLRLKHLKTLYPDGICNAYARLEGSNKMTDEELDYPTFRSGDIVGCDTAHSYNNNMDFDEKVIDAILQIKNHIKSYEKHLKKRPNLEKMKSKCDINEIRF